MRIATSFPISILLAAAEVTVATLSPSTTAAPTALNTLPKTFITTASNVMHTAPTASINRRNPELITSALVAVMSARPSVFTSVTCLGNYGEEDGYVKHRCKMYEYKLKELESGAGCALPMLSYLWAMAGLAAVAMLLGDYQVIKEKPPLVAGTKEQIATSAWPWDVQRG